jgi:hypothetical protein
VIHLELLDRESLRTWGRDFLAQFHYLRKLPDSRTSLEGYAVHLGDSNRIGLITFGRPQATRCKDWYGSVKDVITGRCEITRWQVLNLSRLALHPKYQIGGECYTPEHIPGFTDRFGKFRSTLASKVIQAAMERVNFDYLIRRPPVYLDEPYEIKWLMSYHDTRIHRGIIYRASGFAEYYLNDDGIQTWRQPLPALTAEQDAVIRQASLVSKRAQEYRAKRAQLQLFDQL